MSASLTERRQQQPSPQLWNELTPAQKMALYHVSQYGFELLFIRHSMRGLAIAALDERLLTIDRRGHIDPQPRITLRPLH
ncbi:MAG: hypothetical protein II007_15775 [Gammaproteobacteria bacterium]|nr:hypothetical protein [Gammaproteobacteria bacterium]